MSLRPRIPFARQVLALQVGVVLVVACLGYALVAWRLDSELRGQYGQRALTLARSVAADPDIGEGVRVNDQPRVQARAEAVRRRTGALFVVVTDRNGTRLAHPNPDQIGARVSTDPSGPLAGREVWNIERGTLGLSARGKVPLHDGTGAIVGEVSVGFDAAAIDHELHDNLEVLGLFVAGAAMLGILASAAIGRRLKRQTLGLEPYELVELVQEREAVLHGVGEGVVAVDPAGRVAVGNVEAGRLLGATPERGAPAEELAEDGALRDVLAGRREADNLFVTAGERVLVVNRREVRRGGRHLGAVITLRDRTDLETLARELDSVHTLLDALRAQRHEYANRLHTLSGLLQLGHHEEAGSYMETLVSDTGPIATTTGAHPLADPFLQAFLAAKRAVAAEKGVRLDVGEGSMVLGRVAEPLVVTTVVGNLVDNAIEAARSGERRPARVEVELLGDDRDLHVTVADSGDGVLAGMVEDVFRDGVSTRHADDGRTRGLGLGLARRTARSLGGDVTFAEPADEGGGGGGAVAVARLPGVLGTEVAG
ncbi:sensor histidine kinase [Actinomadura barringtoniae]|uniref:Sensor histidine kinase n=1 Tax=Actinomadura barringtoniae TaxID=1427535 RepID=A0A939T7N7_9ACTN|nr:sensor histidine kinase [Actinomadura barringtoniae]MBO2453308.1 sensor histidine kinase [Actinomadura barringtoniae]